MSMNVIKVVVWPLCRRLVMHPRACVYLRMTSNDASARRARTHRKKCATRTSTRSVLDSCFRQCGTRGEKKRCDRLLTGVCLRVGRSHMHKYIHQRTVCTEVACKNSTPSTALTVDPRNIQGRAQTVNTRVCTTRSQNQKALSVPSTTRLPPAGQSVRKSVSAKTGTNGSNYECAHTEVVMRTGQLVI